MTKLQVRLQDGTKFYVEVESYEVKALEDRINDETKAMVSLGDAIVQRYNILSVMPAELAETEEDNTKI